MDVCWRCTWATSAMTLVVYSTSTLTTTAVKWSASTTPCATIHYVNVSAPHGSMDSSVSGVRMHSSHLILRCKLSWWWWWLWSMLSLWHSPCEISPGWLDECRIAPAAADIWTNCPSESSAELPSWQSLIQCQCTKLPVVVLHPCRWCT